MTITAKFPGTCRTCSKPFARGTTIEWSKEGGARHADCKAAPDAPVSRSNLCPDCGKVELTRYEIRKGYHCHLCTRAEEGPYADTGWSGGASW